MLLRKLIVLVGAGTLAVAALAPWQDANATNGMIPSGFGAQSKGMGGAGVAMSLDAQTPATNPAGIIGMGNRFDVGISAFVPLRDFTVTGATAPLVPGETQSRSEFFLVPEMGAIWDIDGENAVALTMTAAGGMNTDYDGNVYGGFGAAFGVGSIPTGIDLAQVLVAATYAREIVPGHSFGISPVLAAQRFKATGLEAFKLVSTAPTHLTGNGYDYSVGYGFRAGYRGRFFDIFHVGAAYQSRMYMTEFHDYKGLFAEQGDFDMPAISTIGFALDITPTLTAAFDWQHIFYNDIDAIANSSGTLGLASLIPAFGGTLTHKQLGADNGIGFGWEDMDVFKFGLQWKAMDQLTIRAGFSRTKDDTFDTNQILFNILAPGVPRTHASIGATYVFSENHAINFAYTRAFSASITGTDPNLAGGTQNVELRMDQHDGVISYTYSW